MKSGLFALAVLSTLASQAQDIRKVNWGMNQAAVRAKEVQKPNQQLPTFLQYSVKVGRYPAGLTYRFDGGQLIRAVYTLAAEHSEHQLYMDDLRDVAATLTAKYGQPVGPELDWKNTLLEGQTDKYGLAIASGHLVITQHWQTPTTLIVQTMGGDNYQINHTIYYLSRRHPQPADEETSQDF